MANNNKIERAAVRAVADYIDNCPRLESYISEDDKIPIWDGDIFIYNNVKAKKKEFVGRVPVQVKGRFNSNNKIYYAKKEDIEGYKADRGCIFFKVLVNENSRKILYAILSIDKINALLRQSNKTIRIDLQEVPETKKFEEEIISFAAKRNGLDNEHSSPKEIAYLVNEFEEIRDYLDEIENQEIRYNLESFLDSIKNVRDDGTIRWRDKFIYYSRKAIDMIVNNIMGDFFELQHDFGLYLHEQKLYHLVEDYYLRVLTGLRNVVTDIPRIYGDLGEDFGLYENQDDLLNIIESHISVTLNNLGALHMALNRYDLAEKEYSEALEIAKTYTLNKESDGGLADILNNMAILHRIDNRYEDAEKEYKEALDIYKKEAEWYKELYDEMAESCEDDQDTSVNESEEILIFDKVANALNNLGALHYALKRYEEAEQEYKEALEIRQTLAEKSPDIYIKVLADTLINLGVLCYELKKFSIAEEDYLKALKIYRELAEKNPGAYNVKVAMILNNLGNLYSVLTFYEDAEKKYQEALEIYRELAKTNQEAYEGNVANTLFNLALLLQKDKKRLGEARDAANEALGIYGALANKYPQIWSKDVEKAQRLLDELNDVEK